MIQKFTGLSTLFTLLPMLALATPSYAGGKLKLKSNSVSSKHIRDGNVTGSKIAPGSVSAAHIAPGAVTAAKLEPNIGIWTNTGGNLSTFQNVGIGTTTPTKGALEINGSIVNNPSPGGMAGSFNSFGNAQSHTTITTPVSIYASEEIWGSQFIADSDARIKNIQRVSDSTADLSTVLGIEITDYIHKDVATKGSRQQKKVIAQQVEKVFPQAVSRSTDVVPDIYERAFVSEGWVAIVTDLRTGERVRLIGETEEGIYEVLEIRDGAFRTAFQPETEEVFVYGREVDDFRNVDYDAIAMLNVSATQELYRKNVALEKRVAELEAENQLRDAKLTAIERRLETHGASFTSQKTVASAE